jgi:1-deoxy-D-xylulose-5-phosphate reductoisomerase
MKKKIVILGSTGSIGKTLINIIKKNKKNFKIELLTANKNYKTLITQAKLFKVKNIILIDKKAFIKAKFILKKTNINIFDNFNSLDKIFNNKKIDYTMSSIAGLDGLDPTLKIIKFTKKVAIANKESIICGWTLIKKKIKKYKTEFIPVDSEHFSIWSLLSNAKNNNIEKIIITASGGPFRKYPLNQFKNITPVKALKHPNWSMGKKISIDSATMMNKVFEIIEAQKIFDLNYSQLEVVLHPQSYLHALVKFDNGLIKLLVHDTNMSIPIFNSIYPHYEEKIISNEINFKILNNLSLEYIDKKRFPVMKILDVLKNKNSLFETVVVTANDCLVKLFLDNKIKFTDISTVLLKIINLNEFRRFSLITPKNIKEITKLSDYVSLKINNMSI